MPPCLLTAAPGARVAGCASPARRALLARIGTGAAGALLASACRNAEPLSTVPARAERRANIERDFYAALARCNGLAPQTRAAFDAAFGVLAFPTIVAAGVNGELAGDGALRAAQVFTGYYQVSAAPGDVHALVFLFMTLDALARFQRAPVWPAGARDVAIPLIGADGRIDPRSHGAAILAIALDAHTLLPALTLKDLHVVPLDL
jgi:hypothetical protein